MPEVSMVGLDIQFSGSKDIKGFSRHSLFALCMDKLKGKDGWIRFHFKQQPRGNAHYVIHANSVLDNEHITTQAEGYGLEQTCQQVLKRIDQQFTRRMIMH